MVNKRGGGRSPMFEHYIYMVYSKKIVVYKFTTTIFINGDGVGKSVLKTSTFNCFILKIPDGYKVKSITTTKYDVDQTNSRW